MLGFQSYLRFCLLILVSCLFACTATQEKTPEQETSKSETQLVLETLTEDKATAIGFYISPRSTTNCQSMYVEISRRDNHDELWEAVFSFNPKHDFSRPAEERAIKDQLQFAILDKPGEYGVTGIGCQPYDGQLYVEYQLYSTFTPVYGRLNILGELQQKRLEQDEHVFTIGDRFEDATAAVTRLEPELISYLSNHKMISYPYTNHDGQSVSPEDVLANVNKSKEYILLYSNLQKIMNWNAYVYEDFIDGAAKYMTIEGFLKKQDRLLNIFEQSRETYYEFEDLQVAGLSFDVIQAYDALLYEETTTPLNIRETGGICSRRKCMVSNPARLEISARLKRFRKRHKIETFRRKDTVKLIEKRNELREEHRQHIRDYFSYTYPVPNHPTSKYLEKSSRLSAVFINSWIELLRFDAARGLERYEISEENRLIYWEFFTYWAETRRSFVAYVSANIDKPRLVATDEFLDLKTEMQAAAQSLEAIEAQLY